MSRRGGGYRRRDTGYRIRETEYGRQNTGDRIRETEYGRQKRDLESLGSPVLSISRLLYSVSRIPPAY
jgi:hypothetical protein